jgi:hypothetical protein
MEMAKACDALKTSRRLELDYAGQTRVVEVHAVGYSREDKPLVRAWQVRGGSTGGSTSGWKLFRLDDVSSSKIIDEVSEAPRRGYRRGDPAIHRIVAEL